MSTCGCIKRMEFDVELSHKGCEFLLLEDRSTWVTQDGFNKPSEYLITLEIGSRDVNNPIRLQTNGKTVLTSEDLFGTRGRKCLPDEIYCIKTVSCGYELSINRAYLCNTEVKIDELVAKYADTMTKDQRETIFSLKNQVDAIKVNAQRGNTTTAKALFKMLTEQLKSLTCDNC